MIYVFKEFSFRCLYCFILYSALASISYLNLGTQLEYFQGYQSLNQASTFCYEASSWQWLEPMGALSFQDNPAEMPGPALLEPPRRGATAFTVADYASKTWLALSLPCLFYLNPLLMTCQFYVLFNSLIFQAGFTLYQLWAFLNPAVLATFVTRTMLVWHLAVLFSLVHFTLLLNLGFMFHELSFETLDSELIKPGLLR